MVSLVFFDESMPVLSAFLVVSWCVVSAVVFPGTRAPAAPVPVESPDAVFGLPLQPVKASAAHTPVIMSNFFIGSF